MTGLGPVAGERAGPGKRDLRDLYVGCGLFLVDRRTGRAAISGPAQLRPDVISDPAESRRSMVAGLGRELAAGHQLFGLTTDAGLCRCRNYDALRRHLASYLQDVDDISRRFPP